MLSSCSIHVEVCLALDVLGGQLPAIEKASILILDNNRKNPPWIVSFWLFWGCLPCLPAPKTFFPEGIAVHALLPTLGCGFKYAGIAARWVPFELTNWDFCALNAALPRFWRQRLVALGSETNKAKQNKPRAPVGLLDQRQY